MSEPRSTDVRLDSLPSHARVFMSVDKYRRHAVECLRIAEGVPDPRNRMLLIDMAQSWLVLAQQAENPATDPAHETSPPRSEADGAAVVQQQQQIQPKKDE
jgi:hypothetical protein